MIVMIAIIVKIDSASDGDHNDACMTCLKGRHLDTLLCLMIYIFLFFQASLSEENQPN